MAETGKVVAKDEEKRPAAATENWPVTNLRREIDRLFDDFPWGSWRLPSPRSLFDVAPAWRGEMGFGKVPAC